MSTVEDGVYQARAIMAALGETSKGTEQVGVEFELQDGSARHITWYGYFSEKAVEGTLKALRTCGWKGNDLTDLAGIEANEVTLIVEAEEYEGKWRSKVKWINASGALALKQQLTPEKASAFAARMRGQVLAYDQRAGTSARKSTTQAPPPHTDSDKPPF